jgi:hypothetical protein
MMSLPSPLSDSTNHKIGTEVPPLEPYFGLDALVAASLERLGDSSARLGDPSAKRQKLAPLECQESGTFLEANELPLETSARPRHGAVSRLSNDGTSSRSSSPATSTCRDGYRCLRCGREYASTDAVRKHARQNHGEWLKEQGTGATSLYCVPVAAEGGSPTAADASSTNSVASYSSAASSASSQSLRTPGIDAGMRTAGTVLATPPPAGSAPAPAAAASAGGHASSSSGGGPVTASLVANVTSATRVASTVAAAVVANTATSAASRIAAVPLSPASSSMLRNAAEMCLGLSKAAHSSANADDAGSYYGDEDGWLGGGARWPVGTGLPAKGGKAGGGYKRPRSVRCGQCDGCLRDDCGTCKNCVDKPKFGGIGQRKQGCVRKLCRTPRVAQ